MGLNEEAARNQYGVGVKVLKWNFSENDRARTEGKTRGLVKIITSKNGRILGAGIAGANAGELIAIFTLAVTQRLKVSVLANLVLPYPTLGEVGKRAAVTYYTELPHRTWLRRTLGILKLLG